MKKINWTAALSKPVEDTTPKEMRKLCEAAEDWTMCACGNLCDAIPRNDDDCSPKDHVLRGLGSEFYDVTDDMERSYGKGFYEIANCHRRKAIAIHNKIERRAALLLKRMGVGV